MRRSVNGSVWFVSAALLVSVLAGCDCNWCGPSRTVPEAPIVQVPPQEPMTIAPVPPPPAPPAPLEIPAPPPPPEPITTHEAPRTTEVPQEVVTAIEDLGTKYPGLFTFDRQRGMFRFNSDITFDSGSSVVKPQARAALTKLAEILSGDQARDRQLSIIGYTDTDPVRKASTVRHLTGLGKPANNMGLSEARAEAVQAVLAAGGVARGRMTTRGRGTADPVASNATREGKAQNRRVEIFLTTLER